MPSKKLKIDVSGAADNDGREQTPSKVIILRMTPDKLKMLLGTSTTPNTRVNAKTVINRYNSPLLKLPPEVTDKIYQYAVYVDGAIKPVQFLQRSNKFIWAESQVVGFRQAKEVEAAEPLTVVQLTQSCHKMYVDVAATHMFYAINHFDFVKPWSYYYNNNENAVNYLLAITPNRLSSIRTITLSLQYAWYNGFMTKGLAIDTFTALGTCSGLENLHLIIRSSYHGPADISLTKAAGFKQLRAAVRGLKSLKVTFQKDHGIDNVKEYEIVEPLLVEEMSKPRDACFSVGDFRRAQLNVKLDIHGEGRLARDKKPNFVASRTRQGIRKEAASDGTLSNGPIAKYDAGGSLNWVIDDVKASRPSSIDGIDSVEFLVSCDSERTVFNWFEDRSLRKGNHIQEFWEDLSKLNSKESRNSCRLLAFYRKTPEAFGKDLVLKDWETKDNDGGDEEEGYKVTLGKLRSLRALVRADLKAADRAVKSEALKAAKAKATKAKAAADKKQAKGKKSYN